MKRTASYNNKNFQKIRHFLPINITVASREKKKIPEALVNKGFLGFCSLFKLAKFYLLCSVFPLFQFQNSSFLNCFVWIRYVFI